MQRIRNVKKQGTLSEIVTTQEKSAIAHENLRDDPETADEIRSMSPREFAEWRGIEVIENPTKRENTMAKIRSSAALQRQVSALEEENSRLRGLLAEFADNIDEELGLDNDEADEIEDDEEIEGEEEQDEEDDE